jgi:hypothetical protein
MSVVTLSKIKLFFKVHYLNKGRFTPRGHANFPFGRLHEILAFFGLEVGLRLSTTYI